MSDALKDYPQKFYHILGQSLHQFVAKIMDEDTFRKGLLEVRGALSGLQSSSEFQGAARDGFEQFEWAIKLLEEYAETNDPELMQKSKQSAQEGRNLLNESLGPSTEAGAPAFDAPSWNEALELRKGQG